MYHFQWISLQVSQQSMQTNQTFSFLIRQKKKQQKQYKAVLFSKHGLFVHYFSCSSDINSTSKLFDFSILKKKPMSMIPFSE